MTTMAYFEGQQEERAPTQFQSVGNAPANYNGYTLMVTAYALLWAILMVWLLLMWEKSRNIAARVNELDLAIDRAAAGGASAGSKAAPQKKEAQKKDAGKSDGTDGTTDP
jgi:hypothetical protein